MLKKLVIAHNPLEISTWEIVETEDICKTLKERFDVFPATARIYHENVDLSNDVTPKNEADIETLSKLEGTFYMINYPGWDLLIIAVILIIVAIVAIVLRPKIPNAVGRNNQAPGSPNNELSGRTNSIRVNGRIPDIFGTVRSTPDLIAVPYTVFENSIEIEYAYMCIGRGSYAINPANIRDGQTAIAKLIGDTTAADSTTLGGSKRVFAWYDAATGISSAAFMQADYSSANEVDGSLIFTVSPPDTKYLADLRPDGYPTVYPPTHYFDNSGVPGETLTLPAVIATYDSVADNFFAVGARHSTLAGGIASDEYRISDLGVVSSTSVATGPIPISDYFPELLLFFNTKWRAFCGRTYQIRDPLNDNAGNPVNWDLYDPTGNRAYVGIGLGNPSSPPGSPPVSLYASDFFPALTKAAGYLIIGSTLVVMALRYDYDGLPPQQTVHFYKTTDGLTWTVSRAIELNTGDGLYGTGAASFIDSKVASQHLKLIAGKPVFYFSLTSTIVLATLGDTTATTWTTHNVTLDGAAPVASLLNFVGNASGSHVVAATRFYNPTTLQYECGLAVSTNGYDFTTINPSTFLTSFGGVPVYNNGYMLQPLLSQGTKFLYERHMTTVTPLVPGLTSQILGGTSLEIYGPRSSPNDGNPPQLRLGQPIQRQVISALRSKSVNGQTLLAPNENNTFPTYTGYNFNWEGWVYRNDGSIAYTDPTQGFHIGDTVSVSAGPMYDFAVTKQNTSTILGGTYTVFGAEYQDLAVRFYPDGRMEFQSITNVGSSDRPLNDDGRGYLELIGATVTDGTHTAKLSGKYVVTAYGGGTAIIAEYPLHSTPDWSVLSSFAGGVSPYITCTFHFPSLPALNFSGTYTVTAVDSQKLTFDQPWLINNDWVWLHYARRNQIERQRAYLSIGPGSGWIGPFVLDVDTTTEVIANFVAQQGMYKDNGTVQTATSVDIQVGIVKCDSAGNSIGTEVFYGVTLNGSATLRSLQAVTLYADPAAPGRFAVRARRLTIKDLGFTGQISDEVKWRDLYSSSPVGSINFGDVTTVHSKTVATQAALAVSERQLNMIVTRKVPAWVGGTSFTSDLRPSNSADDIISFICLDPKLGNRQKSEVDFANIYSVVAQVKTYFNLDEAGQFNYTIASDSLSFEETLQMVAGAIFCTANRRGNVIELAFEKLTPDSALLFNHRNKVPLSETRTINFSNLDSFDGIEYDYVSPVDDSIATIFIPTNRSAVKPRKIESVGVRSDKQAHLHAWREFNKLRYQYAGLEFEATQEADLLSIGDRILVADNTRPDIQDGEIVAQTGLILTLSQPVVIKPDVAYIISLQLPSGIVQNIGVTAGADPYSVLLGAAPNEPLVTADDRAAKTTYMIVRSDDTEKSAFIVSDKSYQTNFTCKLQGVNYDSRYYANDFDYV